MSLDNRKLIALLVALSAFGPMSMSIYTPAMTTIGHALMASDQEVKLTLTTFLIGFSAPSAAAAVGAAKFLLVPLHLDDSIAVPVQRGLATLAILLFATIHTLSRRQTARIQGWITVLKLILLGLFHQLIDVWGYKRWTPVFVWIGANAITLYFLNDIVGFEPFALRFVGGDFRALVDRLTTEGTGSFLAHLLGLSFAVALAGFFYRRKIFLRV